MHKQAHSRAQSRAEANIHTPGHPIPLTPAAALKLHLDTLSDDERGEILELSEIYEVEFL